ncbi:MAG: hypothetical protein WBG02_15330 [Candidatus Acidiferrum sp.]
MPAFYKIDKERRLVLSSGTGIFNLEDARLHQERLLADSDFDPSYAQLLDFTHTTQIDLTAADIQQLALRNIFSPNSRRAILVPNDLAYGLGRMYEILREASGERGIRIFRNLEDALDWVLSKQEAT